MEVTDTKPLPTGQPTEFDVKRVELKKELPAKGDKPVAVVLKLGLVGPNGEKGWAEHFAPTTDPARWPGEGRKETFVIEPPKQEGWLPSAKRPRQGGGRRRDPVETRAIQRQHSQEMALRMLALRPVELGETDAQAQDSIRKWTDWFEQDIAGGKS